MAAILSISYDPTLLKTRQLLLKQLGHEVTSAEGFAEAFRACRSGHFDLAIIGHSIPHGDKIEIIKEIKKVRPTPVLTLLRAGEQRLQISERSIDSLDTESFLIAVKEMIEQPKDAKAR